MKKNGNPFIHIIIGGNRMGVEKNIPTEKGVVVFRSNPEFYKARSVNFPVVPINHLIDLMAFTPKKYPSFPHIIVHPECSNFSGKRIYDENPETK